MAGEKKSDEKTAKKKPHKRTHYIVREARVNCARREAKRGAVVNYTRITCVVQRRVVDVVVVVVVVQSCKYTRIRTRAVPSKSIYKKKIK